jgi:hypothetical protein
VIHQKLDKIFEKKCWLPVDTPPTEDEKMRERILDENDSDEEEELRKRETS